jgi:hypothetical protein
MNTKKILIGAGAVVVAYQAYKMLSKPRTEKKSSAAGVETLKYKKSDGKVYKVSGKGFDAKWVRLNDAQQPKAMSWYNLNGKWIWTKWNGKLEAGEVPSNQLLA